MLGFSDICSDNDDSEVVRDDNSAHSLGEYSARCSKSGKSDCIFQVPKQSKFSVGLNQDQQWVILGEQAWCLSTCVANNGSQYYQLYHPGIPDESISVRNIVNSSVQQA